MRQSQCLQVSHKASRAALSRQAFQNCQWFRGILHIAPPSEYSVWYTQYIRISSELAHSSAAIQRYSICGRLCKQGASCLLQSTCCSSWSRTAGPIYDPTRYSRSYLRNKAATLQWTLPAKKDTISVKSSQRVSPALTGSMT